MTRNFCRCCHFEVLWTHAQTTLHGRTNMTNRHNKRICPFIVSVCGQKLKPHYPDKQHDKRICLSCCSSVCLRRPRRVCCAWSIFVVCVMFVCPCHVVWATLSEQTTKTVSLMENNLWNWWKLKQKERQADVKQNTLKTTTTPVPEFMKCVCRIQTWWKL